MTVIEKAWMTYFVAYEDWAKSKETIYYMYLAYKNSGNASFKEYRKLFNGVAVQARTAWDLRVKAMDYGSLDKKYKEALKVYSILANEYKEYKDDIRVIKDSNLKLYRDIRNKSFIKEVWKARNKVIKLRPKVSKINHA